MLDFLTEDSCLSVVDRIQRRLAVSDENQGKWSFPLLLSNLVAAFSICPTNHEAVFCLQCRYITTEVFPSIWVLDSEKIDKKNICLSGPQVCVDEPKQFVTPQSLRRRGFANNVISLLQGQGICDFGKEHARVYNHCTADSNCL